MNTDKPCPLCAGPAIAAGEKRGRRTGRLFRLQKCKQCDFTFVAAPWTDYDQIYDETYYRGAGSDPLVDYAFEFAHPNLTIRQYEWRGLAKVITHLAHTPFPRCLDFGSGNGGLVRHLRANGNNNAWGFEPSSWGEKNCQAGLPILGVDDLDQFKGFFDIVTAIEVLEHVVDPVAILQQIRKLLRPGGILFLTTGNADIAPRDFAKWSYVIPEIHTSYYTPRALAGAMHRSGFDPTYFGRIAGWQDILRFKILKNLHFRKVSLLERMLPWPLFVRAADAKYKVMALPSGIAI